MKQRQILSVRETGITGEAMKDNAIYFGADIPDRQLVGHLFSNRGFYKGRSGITSEDQAEKRYVQWLRFGGDGNPDIETEWKRLMSLDTLYIYTEDVESWEVKAFLSVLNAKDDFATRDRPTDILEVGDIIFDISGEYPSPYYVVEQKGKGFFAAKTMEGAGKKLILPDLWGKKWDKPNPKAIAKLMEKVAEQGEDSPGKAWIIQKLLKDYCWIDLRHYTTAKQEGKDGNIRYDFTGIPQNLTPSDFLPPHTIHNFYCHKPILKNEEEFNAHYG